MLKSKQGELTMARKKVAKITKKRLKSKPLAFVDKTGNVRHFARGKKSTILEKSVVSKDLLKKRKAKGKKGILLFVKGQGVFSVARKLRRGKGKKSRSRTARKARLRRRRATTKARRRRSRRCPKTHTSGSHKAAKLCIRAGKGRTIAKRRVFNKAVRRLRASKAGRAWLSKNKVKMAKAPKRKARRSRRRR